MQAANERATNIMNELITCTEFELIRFKQGYIHGLFDFQNAEIKESE
jgi:hypothetical protein